MLVRRSDVPPNDRATPARWAAGPPEPQGPSYTTPSAHLGVERAAGFDAPSAALALQRLIADMAARFAGIDPDAIDDAIMTSLGQVGDALRLDRIVVWPEIGDESADPSHDWMRPTAPAAPAPVCLLFMRATLAHQDVTCFARVEDVADTGTRDTLRQYGIRSAAIVPVLAGRHVPGAVGFVSTTATREWPSALVDQLRTVGAIVGAAIVQKSNHQALQNALEDLQQLRDRVSRDGDESRPSVSALRSSKLIVSESAAIRHALAQVEQVANSNATVLLLGETGVGKEVFAQAIHRLSGRHQRPMVSVSCGAIPSALIESELFGRERGAYTGALTRQIGRFEAANQSTLFLDEIGELSGEVQIKLLRVLQERVIERLGNTQPIKVDVRIIAATNKNLEKAVEDKAFREDLFYRLNVFPIVVPPLRERIEDIPGLAWDFIDEFSKSMGKSIESISEDSMRQLRLYPWPGNVRELRNVIERAVIIAAGPRLTVPMPQRGNPRPPLAPLDLKTLETEHIRTTLESTHWRIRGRGGAAERLGLKPTTLEGRMAKLGLVRPVNPDGRS